MRTLNIPLIGLGLAFSMGLSLAHADANGLTRATGAPVGDNRHSQTAGPHGPTLLQDPHLLEKLAHFDRERIPERVVHARGAGALGVFKATADLSALTRAAPFQAIGKQTPVFVRFSSVIHSNHSPESLRDPRGFAVKFYTEQGNWDLVGNNLPVFFIRDAMQFPDMVHALKPDPKTNQQDPARYFDFFAQAPESTHMLTLLYSPLGIPANYREMNGSSVHAYKFVNAACEPHYVKFTWKSRQGNHGLTREQAAKIQAVNFNHMTQDLYAHIAAAEFPVWDLYVQIVNPTDLDKFTFNPLDATKIWPEALIPSQKIGELTLNQVPDNFFQSTEQSAFAPSNLIPGIEASEDRLLQGRLFAYADTQRYRLGVNHLDLPINAAKTPVHSYNQDGAGYSAAKSGVVNYQPSAAAGSYIDTPEYRYCSTPLQGSTQQIPLQKTENFKQAGDRYLSYSKAEQAELVAALAADLKTVSNLQIRTTLVSFFYKANADYGTRVAKQTGVDIAAVKALAAGYDD